jgi:asparagine synthase (glutamine-hydrolysing)
MCGIAGIIPYRGKVDKNELLSIRDSMFLRGPDGCGIWVSEDGLAGLAHRRLSIIDLSNFGSQPMADQEGNVIVFNGEIYNYIELKKELELLGCVFKSNSDTEVLLYMYKVYGDRMLKKLRGMFAFSLWDSSKKVLFLARDSLGIKPLYYSNSTEGFRFSSQVKSLLKGNVSSEINPTGHVGFFLWGSVPEPYTMYKHINSLPAGHFIKVKNDKPSKPTPFCTVDNLFSDIEIKDMNKNTALTLINDAIEDSIKSHLTADVEVGIFLSAGLDSTLLASCASKYINHQVRTMTLGFNEYKNTENDETLLAQKVANMIGSEHTTTWMNQSDFFNQKSSFFDAMDQPSIDGLNTWLVAKIAADQGIKTVLSGIGGDELFASYPSFKDIPRIMTASKIPSLIPGFGRMFRIVSTPLIKKFTSPKYSGIFEYGTTLGGSYLLRRGLYMPWELTEVLDPDVVREGWSGLHSYEYLNKGLLNYNNSRLSVSFLEMKQYMQNQLLRDADWAGMSHSLEIRTPLADSTLYKNVLNIFAKFPEITKHDVVKRASPNLPKEIFSRPKTGFSVPIQSWMSGKRNDSRGWAKYVYKTMGYET